MKFFVVNKEGRSIGAILDGLTGDEDFYEDYMKSLQEPEAEDRYSKLFQECHSYRNDSHNYGNNY
jgi:hypothetical protein